uniref:J domain-containing protein n=1 Tax=Lotharella globosa TaxID=91324 RepID=A0A7S3Z979_9EUKA
MRSHRGQRGCLLGMLLAGASCCVIAAVGRQHRFLRSPVAQQRQQFAPHGPRSAAGRLGLKDRSPGCAGGRRAVDLRPRALLDQLPQTHGRFNPPQPHRAGQKKASRTPLWVVRGRDFYKILGVSRSATEREIKSAYRKLTKKWHPDRNKAPDASEKYTEINAAYDCLKDAEKRKIYDQYGEEALGAGGIPGAGFDGFGGQSPFGDIFESFFSGGGGGFSGGTTVNLEDLFGGGGMGGGMGERESRVQSGENKMVTLNVDFMDAVFGTNKEFEVSRYEACETCTGSGVAPGSKPRTCATCGGKGQVVTVMRTPLGQLQQVQTCPDCEGAGKTFEKCSACAGQGRKRGSRRISLRIPPGIDSGQRLRVRGEGDAGIRGGSKGDLFVQINVQSHPEFRREGATIHSDAKISYLDAILGKQIKVKTVDGLVDMKVPKGTQPETTLVMRNRGIPILGGKDNRGDHHVHVKVVIPKEMSEDEQKLLEQIRVLQEESSTAKK